MSQARRPRSIQKRRHGNGDIQDAIYARGTTSVPLSIVVSLAFVIGK